MNHKTLKQAFIRKLSPKQLKSYQNWLKRLGRKMITCSLATSDTVTFYHK